MNSKVDTSEIIADCENATYSRIGIMADSHGEPDKIAAALDFLFEKGCDRLYHLGDICDSAHPGTAEACVRPLLESGILAIKGNNDHQIEVNNRSRGRNPGHRDDLIPLDVIEFIKELPLVRSCQHALLTHSLPFARELGLSSMVGTMGEIELNRFFNNYPRGLLFRGHSHDPELIFKQDRRIKTRLLQPGRKYVISDQLPAVVTCGALTGRYCMIWMPDNGTIECHRFDIPEFL